MPSALEAPVLLLHEPLKVGPSDTKMLANIGHLGRVRFEPLLSDNRSVLDRGGSDYERVRDRCSLQHCLLANQCVEVCDSKNSCDEFQFIVCRSRKNALVVLCPSLDVIGVIVV